MFYKLMVAVWMAIGLFLGITFACASYDAARSVAAGIKSIQK